jgi:hypothetical protein
MDLAEEREDSAPILGKIGSPAKETTPEDENETLRIKETHPEARGTSHKSSVPQVSSIPMVNYILPYYAIPISIQSVIASEYEYLEDIGIP